ncbi:adenylate kinase family protein [uncultured Methanobrevibacter sp.]|uniref:adenylate kinase family protein n=1 Tax=uncultured Methanobrevibacter sp. TaxID=253161 RepID=UPI0025E65158|nr:adenylate kinase family protein [uncultured Methanobrevibacter sp.]
MINKTIFISGTPCTGKTTISQILFDKLNLKENWYVKLIKTNELAFGNDLILGRDPEKDYKIVDIENLDKAFNNQKNEFFKQNKNKNKLLIFEGHLSHFCSGADKVIILRAHPDKLKIRLSDRNYTSSKINENLLSEALAVCSVEAYEKYGDNTCEIDVTDKSPEDVLDIICKIICHDLSYPVGEVDFIEWVLKK